MINLAVSEARMICGGANEALARELGKATRGYAARKECQRELKEELAQVRMPTALLLLIRSSLPKVRPAGNLA